MREEALQSSRSMPGREYDQEELGLGDAIRFLHANRSRLTRYFLFFLGVGLLGIVPWRLSYPRAAEGRVSLAFDGIEKGEYPDGKKFNPEDFRAPSLVREALADAGISKERANSGSLPADISVFPVIPADVAKRWEKEAKDGVKKEEYFPTQFNIAVDLKGLSNDEGARFFSALVRRYRERAKSGQMAALRLTSDVSMTDAGELLRKNEYSDIPRIMDQSVELFGDYLNVLIARSNDYSDPELHFGFSDVKSDLETWKLTRLEALKAMAARGKLVKDKSAALMRAQYRLDDLDIQIRRRSEETAQAMKLLESIPRIQPILTAPKTNKDDVPTIDASVLDRLMSGSYIAPLVKRISDLQAQTKTLEAEKWRLERDLAALPAARNVEPKGLPAGYVASVGSAAQELQTLISRYNTLMDRYVDSTVASRISAVAGPSVKRESPSLRIMLAAVVAAAGLLAGLLAGVPQALRAVLRP